MSYATREAWQTPRVAMLANPTKLCTKCGQDKVLDEYHRAAKEADGRKDVCKSCTATWMRTHYANNRAYYRTLGAAWTANNKDRVRGYSKSWYERNKTRLAPIRKAYAAEHVTEGRLASHRHYMRNRENVLERCRKYRKEKPDVQRAAWMRRRAREFSSGTVSAEALRRIREAAGDSCVYCRVPLNGGGEFDHATPLSLGGLNVESNITLACRSCNRSKGTKTPSEFSEYRRHVGV